MATSIPIPSAPDHPRLNRLLGAMMEAEFARIAPDLELVQLKLGQVIHESGQRMAYAYFPTTALVSLFYLTQDGASMELAVVGNRGVIGVSLLMGGDAMSNTAVVQTAGSAYRLKAQLIRNEFNRNGLVMLLLLRYTQALSTQIAQTGACNRYHSIEQQLCRWLLIRSDRLRSNQITATQEGIGHMLGVRREGVTEAARKMQEAGLIKYSRGFITLLDRPRMEKRVCECYAVVRREYDRLLPEKALNASAAPLSPSTSIYPQRAPQSWSRRTEFTSHISS